MSDTDFVALIEPVARHFWGEPPKGFVTRVGIRWGNSGSKSVDLQKGTWFDHEAGQGGGVLDLVMQETGSDKAGALDWLRTEGFLEPRQMPQERHNEPPAHNPPPEQESPPAPAQHAGRWTIVATYDYTNGDGDLLYQVARIQWKLPDGSWELAKSGKPDKTFRQRRPSGLPDGSWVWGLDAGRYVRAKDGHDWSKFDKDKHGDGAGLQSIEVKTDVPHGLYRLPAIEQAIEAGKTVLIVEGEKAVHAAVDLGFEATCNSGGANKFHDDLLRPFRGARVVILPDNDPQSVSKRRRKVTGPDGEEQIEEWEEPKFHPDGRPVRPGIDHAQMVARKLRSVAASVKVIELPGLPPKGDIVEWAQAGGTAEKLQQIVAGEPEWRPRPPTSAMGAVGLHQLHHPSLKHDFLIDGFLDRQGVAMMPGASGSGKTFLVLEMAMCTALGLDFWGMKTKPGLVLYQAGEGKQGVTKRLDGWFLDRGMTPGEEMPFKMLTRRVNLFVDDKDTDELIGEGKAWAEYFGQPVRMVVIDTFNKAITGANENAGQDMTKVISRLERISVSLDCAVVVPIHKSAEGKMRGHTSLTGDVSNVINVTELQVNDRNGRAIRTVQLDKNKDGEKGRPLRFVLRQVVLDPEADGKPVTTCVVDRPDGDEEEAARQGKLSLNQYIILKALKQAIEDHGEPAPSGIRAGSQVKVVTKFGNWVDRVRKSWVFQAPETEPEKRNKELERVMTHAGKVLLAGEYIGRDNDLKIVWLTGKDDRPKRERKPADPPPPLPAEVRSELPVEGVPF